MGASPAVRPRDFVEFTVLRIIEDIVGEPCHLTDNFFAVGGTSLGALQLLQRVEDALQVPVNAETFLAAPSAESLAAAIRNGRIGAAGARVIPISERGDGVGVYLVHGQGGEVFAYEPLRSAELPAPVFAIRARGCDGEQPPLTTFASMAQDYAQLVDMHAKPGPVVIGGFCLGASIAVETARALLGRGRPVQMVLAFDSELVGPTIAEADRARLKAGRHPITESLAKAGLPADIFDLERDSWQRVTRCLIDAGRLPPGCNSSVIEGRLSLIGSNLLAWSDYRPTPLEVPVHLTFGSHLQQQGVEASVAEWHSISPSVDVSQVIAVHERFFAEASVVAVIDRVMCAVNAGSSTS